MEFERDEAKRLKNIASHGLDFVDAGTVFSGPLMVAAATDIEGERRFMATGRLDDIYVTTIYTMRGDVTRIISMRRARHGERRHHQDIHGT